VIEWVLVLTMHIVAERGGPMPDVQMQTVDGFTSSAACENAGQRIGRALIKQVGKHRDQQNIDRRGGIGFPSVYTECLKVNK
jgi:hypothetical protein